MSKSRIIKSAVEEAASVKALATEKATREVMQKIAPKIERSVLEALHNKRGLDDVVSRMVKEAEVNFHLDPNAKMNVHIPDDQSATDLTADVAVSPDQEIMDFSGDDEEEFDFSLEGEESEEEEPEEEEEVDSEEDEIDFDLDVDVEGLLDEEEETEEEEEDEETGVVADSVKRIGKKGTAYLVAENYLKRAKFLSRISEQVSDRRECFNVLSSAEGISEGVIKDLKQTGYEFYNDKEIKKTLNETKNYIKLSVSNIEAKSDKLLNENKEKEMRLTKNKLNELKIKFTPETEEERMALMGASDVEVEDLVLDELADHALGPHEDEMEYGGEEDFDLESASERIDSEMESLDVGVEDEDCDPEEEDCEDEDEDEDCDPEEDEDCDDEEPVPAKENKTTPRGNKMSESRKEILERRIRAARAQKLAEARQAKQLSSLSNQEIARELRRRRALLEAKAEHETAARSIGGTKGPEAFADDLDLNANDDPGVVETRRDKMKLPRKPLEEALKERVRVLEAKLKEAEVDKQKLLFACRVLKEETLTAEQKRTAVYALDSATSIAEAKLAYKTASLMIESSRASAKPSTKDMALQEARRKAREAVARKSQSSMNESAPVSATRTSKVAPASDYDLAEKMINSFKQ